ncbi:MAG: hypothetical protein R3322_00385 [Kiloniellales bacterium]|nr:hypothetical protein [Kiloniellales bacterium]
MDNGKHFLRIRRSDGKAYVDLCLYGITRVFNPSEWSALMAGDGVVCDIFHRVERWCEVLYYYESPASNHIWGPGFDEREIGMKVVCIDFPYGAAKELAQAAFEGLLEYDGQEPNEYGDRDSVVVELDARWPHWCAHYGQGKGRVEWRFQNDEIRERWQAWCARNDKTFERCRERLEAIARNTTWSADETGTVHIGYDFAGFGFSAARLIGGVINHGDDDAPDWSIHT